MRGAVAARVATVVALAAASVLVGVTTARRRGNPAGDRSTGGDAGRA